MSFEDDVVRLEAIVRDLERDDLDLDRALHLFQEGIACLRRATGLLSEAKGKVQELVVAADGSFDLEERSTTT